LIIAAVTTSFSRYLLLKYKTIQGGKIIKLSKVIRLSLAAGIYWQDFLATESDASVWQPLADHPVRDTFLDSRLHGASRCSSPRHLTNAGRLEPVVFDEDRMWQRGSE